MRVFLLPAVLALAASTAQAAPDAFTQACLARPKATPASCSCQARLAKATFTTREHATLIRAMQGDQAGFRTSLDAMGETGKRTFVGKMQTLSAKSESLCH